MKSAADLRPGLDVGRMAGPQPSPRNVPMSQPRQSPIGVIVFVAALIAAYAMLKLAPNPMLALAALWGSVFLIPYVLGPILIRRSQWMGTEETSEPADLDGDAVPDDVARTFRFVDGELSGLGFERVSSSIDRGRVPKATAYLAVYRHREAKEVARFLAVVAESARVRKFNPVLSFSTEFADGTEVYTANGRGPRIGPRLGPPVHGFDFPEVGEVDRLLRLHRAAVARFEGGRLRVDAAGQDPLGLQRRINRRYQEMVVARGYYHADDDHRRLRPTWKGAILMAWQLAWPVKPLASASRKARSARLIRQLESEGRDGGFPGPR